MVQLEEPDELSNRLCGCLCACHSFFLISKLLQLEVTERERANGVNDGKKGSVFEFQAVFFARMKPNYITKYLSWTFKFCYV